MQPIRISTVFVVLTVLLAGCAGVTDSSSGPTATADGTTGSDDLSLDEADERLRAAGSFTTQWSYTVREADGTTTQFNNTYEVDLDANRSREVFSTSGPDARTDYEVFVADGTSYTRYGSGDDAFYQTSDQPSPVFDSATGRAAGFYNSLEADATFEGTESYDGVTVSRYEYADPEAWAAYNQGLASASFDTDEEVSVTEFSISVLVDGNDVARLTTWTVTGETESGDTVSIEWAYSITDIGSTTVEEPDWLDEA
jgi:hypothetical protein